MGNFFINLNEMSDKRSRLLKTWLTGAAVFMVLAIMSYFILGDRLKVSGLGIIIFAVYLVLYIYYAYVAYRTKLYIESTDYAIRYRFGMISKSSTAVIWEAVSKIKIGPAYIAIYKHSGKRKVLRLGWLPYIKVVDIKKKFEAACRVREVRCEIAKYNK